MQGRLVAFAGRGPVSSPLVLHEHERLQQASDIAGARDTTLFGVCKGSG